MAKKIKPSQISVQVDYSIDGAIDFSADLLEDVNAHTVAALLRALNIGEYDLACDFIKLEKEHVERGSLTPDLYERRNLLLPGSGMPIFVENEDLPQSAQ